MGWFGSDYYYCSKRSLFIALLPITGNMTGGRIRTDQTAMRCNAVGDMTALLWYNIGELFFSVFKNAKVDGHVPVDTNLFNPRLEKFEFPPITLQLIAKESLFSFVEETASKKQSNESSQVEFLILTSTLLDSMRAHGAIFVHRSPGNEPKTMTLDNAQNRSYK